MSRPSFSRQYFSSRRGALAADDLRGKRLVDLDEIGVLQAQAVALLGLVDGVHRAEAHARRVAAGVLEADELAQRRQAAGLERAFSLIMSSATAPSVICEALPAVTEPLTFSNTGRSLPSASIV